MSVSSREDERLAIHAAADDLDTREALGQAPLERLEGGSLARGVQRAHHCEPRGHGVQGVVVTKLARQKEMSA